MAGDLARDGLGERDEPALGRGVDGLARRADAAGVGGDGDDLAVLGLDHVAQRRARARERATQVDREDRVPELRRGLHERHRLVPARAVHEHVQPAPVGDDAVDRRVDGGGVGDVEGLGHGDAAGSLDVRRHPSRAVGVDVGHRHPRALARERQRDGAADAARASRDERRAVLQLHRTIALAMMSFMISLVPPPMVISRASRANRSTGYSRM